MVKLRLRRVGKKKQPTYKIVAADSRAARPGKYLEAIGVYNPRLNPMLIELKEDRLFHWLKNGAQPSDTVRSLLQRKGLWLRWSLMKRGIDESAIASELEKWQMLQAEKLKREVEKKARRKATRKAKVVKPAKAEAPPEEKPPAEKPAESTTA